MLLTDAASSGRVSLGWWVVAGRCDVEKEKGKEMHKIICSLCVTTTTTAVPRRKPRRSMFMQAMRAPVRQCG